VSSPSSERPIPLMSAFFFGFVGEIEKKSPTALIVRRVEITIFGYENTADEIRLAAGSRLSGGRAYGDGCLSPDREVFFAAVGSRFDRGASGGLMHMDFDVLP